MENLYAMEDNFIPPEEIKSLSAEELDRRTAVLEAKAIEEGKNIPEPNKLKI